MRSVFFRKYSLMRLGSLTALGAALCAIVPLSSAGAKIVPHPAPEADIFQHGKKLPVRVVILTAFEIGKDSGDQAGELQNWVENYPLNHKIPAKDNAWGNYYYNEKDHVLGVVLGEGHTNAAQSLTALIKDPRFDLRQSYFILAGIAGGNPNKITVGSVAFARYVVNGGQAHMLDSREMPKNWQDPYIPVQSSKPYPVPRPQAHSQTGDMVYPIDGNLLGWAYGLVKKQSLPDSEKLQQLRKAYAAYEPAQQPPKIILGDVISSETFWAGKLLNNWAERWVDYWTEGKGWLATTAMEDIAVPVVLQREGKAGLVDPKRLLVIRSVSNFDLPPEGKKAADMFLEGEQGDNAWVGLESSVKNVYAVGAPIARNLSENWDKYSQSLPKPAPVEAVLVKKPKS